MSIEERHVNCVDELLARATSSRVHVAQALGLALSAVWNAARETLGEVTLAAIFRRVFVNAKRSFPRLDALRLEPGEECFRRLAGQPPSPDPELAPAVRLLLIELVSVLGSLTAEILTPSIHAALSGVAAAPRVLPRAGATPQPEPKRVQRKR